MKQRYNIQNQIWLLHIFFEKEGLFKVFKLEPLPEVFPYGTLIRTFKTTILGKEAPLKSLSNSCWIPSKTKNTKQWASLNDHLFVQWNSLKQKTTNTQLFFQQQRDISPIPVKVSKSTPNFLPLSLIYF